MIGPRRFHSDNLRLECELLGHFIQINFFLTTLISLIFKKGFFFPNE